MTRYVNHVFYFGTLSSNYKDEQRFPIGHVKKDIDSEFEGFLKFKAKFNMAASKVKGSGKNKFVDATIIACWSPYYVISL